MSKLRLGVLGAHRGLTMIKFLLKYPEAELAAICDKYRPALEKCRTAAQDAGVNVRLFESFDEFLQCDMDAVVLANYATEHVPFALRCLASGRHVLSEVMAVQTLSEAVQLVEAVERSGLVYGYAENYCYFRSNLEMRRRYRQGDIGELVHGEGEYIHDCTSLWPSITYGDPNHWRNRTYSTFYISHALGPILYITGERPSRVVGFENQMPERLHEYGRNAACAGMVLLQLQNGATVKAIHGNMKREPVSYWTSLYGTKGCMEADRWGRERNYRLNVYIEGPQSCKGEYTHYEPVPLVDTELSRETTGHFHSDFYTGYFFLEKLLGRPDGEHLVDVYQALDMSLPGILAYRSILGGNVPIDYPDLRDKANREMFRNDHLCTDPSVAGEGTLPSNHWGVQPPPAENYERVRQLWLKGLPG